MAATDRPADVQWLVDNQTDRITGYIAKGVEMHPPAFLDTDANGNTVLVGADGEEYAALPVDANGNIVANVALRKDTLANLLLVADAADGEIAVATDADVLVRYLGSPSVGTVFGRTTEVGSLYIAGAVTMVGSGEDTKLQFSYPVASNSYFLGLFSDANDWFTLPPASVATHFEINCNALGNATGGTLRELALQVDSSSAGDGTLWANMRRFSLPVTAGVVNPTVGLNLFSVIGSSAGKKMRLVAKQDSGSSSFYVEHSAMIRFHRFA